MTAVLKGRTLPGPRGHPLLGSILDFRRDFIQGLVDGWRRHGDVVQFRVGFPMVLLAHPDAIQQVLHENHRNYVTTPRVAEKWSHVVGKGLIANEGDFWRRQRRLMQPAFHRQRIAAFATLMTDTTAELLAEWQSQAERGEPLDLRSEMVRLSLAILAKALFASDWSRDREVIGPNVTVTIEHLYTILAAPINLPDRLPLPSFRRFIKSRAALDDIIYRLIAERRRTGEDRGDLVSMLLQARDEETGAGMTDLQVRDEIITMIFGGHETVSTGLTWTWYLLSKHPHVARRLQAELAATLGGRTPTLEDIPKLRYTTMVLQEAMRLYPPIWLISRTPTADDEIGGYAIPPGRMLLLCPYITHRHPAFWDNPEGFDPERFSPERSAGRHRYAYFPFGGGPRLCIGINFGMLEMQLVLAMMAQRYRLDLVPGYQVVPQPGISLRPRDGMPMTLAALPRP